jgi:hypothetical protein
MFCFWGVVRGTIRFNLEIRVCADVTLTTRHMWRMDPISVRGDLASWVFLARAPASWPLRSVPRPERKITTHVKHTCHSSGQQGVEDEGFGGSVLLSALLCCFERTAQKYMVDNNMACVCNCTARHGSTC